MIQREQALHHALRRDQNLRQLNYWRTMKERLHNDRGASAIEFAIILPVLLLILFGIIEFGIILYDKAIITNASREAARERIVFNAPEENVIKAKIVDNYGSLPINFKADGNVTAEDISFVSITEATGTYITANVTFHYNFLYLPIGRLNLSSSTTMRLEE
jgi:Flp pilus assembly protein TadG